MSAAKEDQPLAGQVVTPAVTTAPDPAASTLPTATSEFKTLDKAPEPTATVPQITTNTSGQPSEVPSTTSSKSVSEQPKQGVATDSADKTSPPSDSPISPLSNKSAREEAGQSPTSDQLPTTTRLPADESDTALDAHPGHEISPAEIPSRTALVTDAAEPTDTTSKRDSTVPGGSSATVDPTKRIQVSLLLTNGNRHPFNITSKYLNKRGIVTENEDPWNISVYDMKQLIWQDWLESWEERPSSPASIRLIFLGGLLDDKLPLRDCRLNRTEPNVVHMTIKPADIPEDEDVNRKEGKGRDGGHTRTGGGCCIIL